jgi:putative glutamine amidotransferase
LNAFETMPESSIVPKIAIPLPRSNSPDYVERAMPQYEHAVQMAGGEPVRIPLDAPNRTIANLLHDCDGILLPGSSADVDPVHYGAIKHEKTAPADVPRQAIDQILLDHAYRSRKPVLGICYGMQSLSVFRKGTLVQHIESAINHEAGRKVAIAHKVAIQPGSRLASIVDHSARSGPASQQSSDSPVSIDVNSSHHQSVESPGEGLRIVARSPEDDIAEAVEGTSPEHFVMAVQWHPERSVDDDEPSRSIFRALIEAARTRQTQSASG